MTADPTTTTKLCTVCGIDCAGKPRIKDQQGRYICKECFDKAKQTRQTQKNPPAPAPVAAAAKASAPTEGDNSFLLDIGSKESTGIAGTKPCPECGRAMPSNAVICIGCGYNASTGKRHTVKVIKTKEKASKDRGSSSGGALSSLLGNGALIGLIICVIHVASALALMADPSIGLAMWGVSILVSLVVWIGTIVAALRENSVWGLMCIIPILALVWGVFLTEDPRIKAIWGGHVLGNILRWVILMVLITK
jgi:hypothetical protein